MTWEPRFKFWEKLHEFEEEIEVRLSVKKIINEIKRLKEETENNKDEFLDNLFCKENTFSKLLTDLEYEKHYVLPNIVVLESKLIKLEISPEPTMRTKNSVLSFQFMSL